MILTILRTVAILTFSTILQIIDTSSISSKFDGFDNFTILFDDFFALKISVRALPRKISALSPSLPSIVQRLLSSSANVKTVNSYLLKFSFFPASLSNFLVRQNNNKYDARRKSSEIREIFKSRRLAKIPHNPFQWGEYLFIDWH